MLQYLAKALNSPKMLFGLNISCSLGLTFTGWCKSQRKTIEKRETFNALKRHFKETAVKEYNNLRYIYCEMLERVKSQSLHVTRNERYRLVNIEKQTVSHETIAFI